MKRKMTKQELIKEEAAKTRIIIWLMFIGIIMFLSLKIWAEPFSSEISPISTACACTLVVLNDTNSRSSSARD